VSGRIPLKDLRQHEADTTGTWVRIGYDTPNREGWLTEAVEKLRPMFARHGASIPPVRVSVGFPRTSERFVGECWAPKQSADGTYEIFITPEIDDPLRVLDILVHELVHTVVGVDAGHGWQFTRLARALGLVGKPRATVASARLRRELVVIARELGPYPHSRITPGAHTPPREPRHRQAPRFEIRTVGRLVALAVVVLLLVTVIRDVARQHGDFKPYGVPTSDVTSHNPWVCGYYDVTSAEVWDPSINGSATTYRVQCSSGETVFDSEQS
jgi:hypothetical protein